VPPVRKWAGGASPEEKNNMNDSPFRTFGRAVCRDQGVAKLLHDLITPYCRDGTELFAMLDKLLPGLEHTAAVKAIKARAIALYADSIGIDTIVDVVTPFVETETSNNSRMCANNEPVSPAIGPKEDPNNV
jgi:hypothetical protein